MSAGWLLAGLIAILPQAPAVQAGATATIRGTVVNGRTLAPVADAQVGLTEVSRATRSTADGVFEFTNVAPGTYTLTVSTIGFIFVRRPVTVAAGSVLDVTVPLAEGTGTYEESVRVTASADVETRSSTVELNSSALQDLRDIAADDPVRAVQALPAAATGDDFRAEFSVRGSAFRHVGIVLDNTATPLLFHTMGGLEDPGSVAMINTDVLDRAKLSIGVHPQEHGEWLSATLAFDLREGSRDRRVVRMAISGTNASMVMEGPLGRARRGSWLVSVRKSYIDWLVRIVEPSIESTVGFADTQTKFGYDLTRRQHVEFVAVGGRANYLKSDAVGANTVWRARSQSALGSAGWHYTSDRVLLSQRVSFVASRFAAKGRIDQQLGNGHTDTWLWRGDASVFANRTWEIDAGAKVESTAFSQALRDFASAAGGTVRVRNELASGDRRTITGLWAQIVHQRGDAVVRAGGRVSRDTATGDTVASPWLVVERSFRAVRVFGGIGQAHQFPTLSEMGRGVDPILTERAWGGDVGVAGAVTPEIFWRVAVYRRRESNIQRRIEEDRLVNGARVVAPPFDLLGSQLDGTARGVEAAVERRAAKGPTGWVGYSWAHLTDRDVKTGEVFDGDFDQRHTLNVFLQQRFSYRTKGTLKLRIGSNFPIVGYFSGEPEALVLGDVRNQVRLPVYARLDLSINRTFTYKRSRLTLFAEFMNTLGRRNLGPGNGSIRSTLAAVGYAERLLPFVPSAGLLMEF